MEREHASGLVPPADMPWYVSAAPFTLSSLAGFLAGAVPDDPHLFHRYEAVIEHLVEDWQQPLDLLDGPRTPRNAMASLTASAEGISYSPRPIGLVTLTRVSKEEQSCEWRKTV